MGVRPAADGTFTLAFEGDRIEPGSRGVLAIQPDGYAPVLFPDSVFAEDGFDVDIPLDRGLALTGRVLAPDGKPVQDAKVSLKYVGVADYTGGSDDTDSAGRFTIPGILARRVQIEARVYPAPPSAQDQPGYRISWEKKVDFDARAGADAGDIQLDRRADETHAER
jgi:hypothetical protein